MRNGLRASNALAGSALCVALCGCGGSYDATVTGVVKLDGAPLPRGAVKFIPDQGGASAYGVIASDGTYTVMTGREEGLKSGPYTMTVVANEPSTAGANPSAPPTPGKPLSPPWYRTAETSPLKQAVEPGDNEVNLELTKQPPPGWKPSPGRR